MLLDHGADINASCSENGLALQVAAHSAEVEVTELLIASGAKVDEQGGQYGSTLLAAASAADRARTLELLIKHGAASNVDQAELWRILKAAASSNEAAAVPLLLHLGIDLDAKNIDSFGDVVRAAMTSSCDAVKKMIVLLDHRADIKTQRDFLNRLLFTATSWHESPRTRDVVKALLDHGASPGACGGEYGYTLIAAVVHDEVNTVELLLDYGADVNARGTDGYPLHYAVCAGNLDMVRLLVGKGAQPNVRSTAFGTCLHEARKDRDIPISAFGLSQKRMVKLLLQHGAIDEPKLPAEGGGTSLDGGSEVQSSPTENLSKDQATVDSHDLPVRSTSDKQLSESRSASD